MTVPVPAPVPATAPVPAPAINEVGDRGPALVALVERARREVPFYAAHLADVGPLDAVAAADPAAADAMLAGLPTCSKGDLARWGRFPLGAVPLNRYRRVAATSGTTGARLFVGYTEADWAAVGDKCARIARHIGFGPQHALLNVLGSGLWVGGPSFDELARAAGAGLFPAGPTNPEQVIEWCESFGLNAITCTPSYLRLLMEWAVATGYDLHQLPLRLAFAGGEGASSSLRRQVAEAFGPDFRWQEMYGSTEVGGAILGYGSPEPGFEDSLDIATDCFVVELLDLERDEAVAPGEIGELTVTSFREGCPLIRYRTRDLARALDGRDGSGLPRISTLLGRIDDAVKVRGALVYPSVIEELVVAAIPTGAEWRIELHRDAAAFDVLSIHIEHHDDAVAAKLAADVHHRTLVRPVVRVVPVGTFERFSGKAKRVDDRRPPD